MFLGNQTGESVVNFHYTSSKDNFLLCQNIASSIPKPLESLHNVRLHGHCLDPILLNRFSRCLIGITAFGEHFEDIKLFTINSAGDLFVQKMKDNTPIEINIFKKLVTTKCQTVSNLNYSNIFDMSKLWKLEPSNEYKNKHKNNKAWNISKEKMLSYIDHLAPLILSPWDTEDLSEWENEDENIEAVDNDSDCDYTTKVNFWFNKNESLLGLTKPLEASVSNTPNKLTSQDTTTKSPHASENDEDSSSG